MKSRSKASQTEKMTSRILGVLTFLSAQILPVWNVLTQDYSMGYTTPLEVYFNTLTSMTLTIIPAVLCTIYLMGLIINKAKIQGND